jgi:hypothetical protein
MTAINGGLLTSDRRLDVDVVATVHDELSLPRIILSRTEFGVQTTCRQCDLLNQVIVLEQTTASSGRRRRTSSQFRKDEEYKIFFRTFPLRCFDENELRETSFFSAC